MALPRVQPLRELGKRGVLALLLLMISTFVVWLDRDSYIDNSRHDGVSFIDALYYSTVTMTTTGYGDITPLAPHARLLNAILITPMRVGFLVLLVGTPIAVLADAGVVFSAVKTEEYIIFPSMLKEGAIVFDLCLPRSCYPSSSLKLYNIENLTNQLEQYKAERQEIAGRIALEIDEELVKFADWRQQLGIIPLIQEIRDKALEAQASAMESLNRKIPDLTEREQKQISKHMKSIINQVLKEPILQLKELSVGEHSDYDIALIAKIFGLHRERGKDEGH